MHNASNNFRSGGRAFFEKNPHPPLQSTFLPSLFFLQIQNKKNKGEEIGRSVRELADDTQVFAQSRYSRGMQWNRQHNCVN